MRHIRAFSGMAGPLSTIVQPRSRHLYVVVPDGSGLRRIPHTRGGFAPTFSPGGESIAFARTAYRSVEPRFGGRPGRRGTTTWVVRLDGTGLRRLTEWRNGVENLPSSFSPDGSALALTHRDAIRDRADAVALPLDGRRPYVLAEGASWPRYSPDGTRIAFLGIRRVGATSCCELGDGFEVDLYAMEARLVYTTKSEPTDETSGDLEAAVMQINADGSCPSKLSVNVPRVAGHHTVFAFPSWQPGPGRGAGRIAC